MKSNIAVIATGNSHKLQEIGEILKGFNLEIKSMQDVNLQGLEIIESGTTFEENALIKAKTVMEKTGYMAIADDSGLEVEYLDCQPGVYSSRFAGEKATDEENNEKLLRLLKDVPLSGRRARFVCVIAVVMPDGENFTVRGELYGVIGFELKGQEGFGYDPLFMPRGYDGLSLAEIGLQEKNKISHRAKALEQMKKTFTERLRGE
ncbi:dITP/XTP pyrophosphatase [Clostridium aceticum]|uniref:dITP/XTP pyrophosphatase n=1 Tax=Clostridium aceticum TaxID=84022 RepID=A0A0D8IE80_9CLOT|nr:RdgB/HAM1 family non-canonical purine NTP pyrophosphatase [Clostridium aceticum]AKL93981.1 dITP/XTP pyrophosphatase [Clostridium aceticum]KJF28635.1 NTP phosphatase [Clostridium aceticum]